MGGGYAPVGAVWMSGQSDHVPLAIIHRAEAVLRSGIVVVDAAICVQEEGGVSQVCGVLDHCPDLSMLDRWLLPAGICKRSHKHGAAAHHAIGWMLALREEQVDVVGRKGVDLRQVVPCCVGCGR